VRLSRKGELKLMISYEETGDVVKIVGAKSTPEGIRAENDYIAQKLGERGSDWEKVGQSLLEEGGVHYDRIEVKLANGESRSFLFDISEFFGIEADSDLIGAQSERRAGCLAGVLAASIHGLLARFRA
jgi:hypothetical protein